MIIAGTGHRPKYCPCKYKDDHPWLINLKKRLSNYLVELGFMSFPENIIRAGGAIGWDTWLAQVALEMGATLHLYLPFPDQGSQWPKPAQDEYERIKADADEVFYTAEEYNRSVFFKRDEQMIEGADTIVALLNPAVDSGGTFYTVNKAKEQKIHIVNFWKDQDD